MNVFFSGIGDWSVPDSREVITDEVAGVFKLPEQCQIELKYKGETYSEFLLPCYDQKDGISLSGYTEQDEVYFKIKHSRSHRGANNGGRFLGIKFTSDDLVEEEKANAVANDCSSEKPSVKTKIDTDLTPKSERTHLNIIAALLQFIKAEIPGIKPHPNYKSEALLISEIEAEYAAEKKMVNAGLSKRTLEEKFSKAKKSLSES